MILLTDIFIACAFSTIQRYRALTDTENAGITDNAKAIALMMHNTSLIKHPVWDLGKGKFFLGWDEKELDKLISKMCTTRSTQ